MKKRVLMVERLESRCVLAASADIVLLVDESYSASDDFSDPQTQVFGGSLQYWVDDMLPKLESRLAERGITDTRYGLTAFGGDDPDYQEYRARIIEVTEGNVWANDPQSLLAAMDTQFQDSGGNEDGWRAFDLANGNERNSTEGPKYEFRSSAALHLILITDEQRTTKVGDTPEVGLGLFTLVSKVTTENAVTDDGLDLLSDAVVTAVVPSAFTQMTNPQSQDAWNDYLGIDRIVGVDLHIASGIDVDRNSMYNNDTCIALGLQDKGCINPDGDWTTDEDMITLFRIKDDNTRIDVQELNEPDAFRVFSEKNQGEEYRYDDMRRRFIGDPNDENFVQYDAGMDFDSFPEFELDLFDAEAYSFLAWEAKGTVWDFAYFNEKFDSGYYGNPDPVPPADRWRELRDEDGDGNPETWVYTKPEVDVFTEAFVDDLLEKTLLQTIDFDGMFTVPDQLIDNSPAGSILPGYISAGDIDMMTYYMLNPPGNTTDAIFRAMDLASEDEQGSLVGVPDGVIDHNDREYLIAMMLATWPGDSDLNGRFDSLDFVSVFIAGEYEDGLLQNSVWAEGDWDGDLDFVTNDFVYVWIHGGYELLVVKPEFLPVWGIEGDLFYRPTWAPSTVAP